MSKRIISSIFLVFLVLTQTFVLADDVFYFAEDSDINDYDDRELTTGDLTTTGTVSTTEGGMGTTGTTGTTGAMSTTSPNGGGTNTTTVYETSVSETENTTVTLNSTAGYLVEISFPPLVGGYSARYSHAASDVAGFEDPTTSMPTNGKFKGVSFFITLMKDSSVAHVNFTQPIIVKVGVPEGSSSDAIYLFNTDNLKWEDAAETCNPKRFINNNGNIELGICHLTQFAVFEVTTSQSSTTGAAAAVVDEPSQGDDAGLIAAVIIIPIVIVGVIISLVAWTLLRNPEKSRKEKDLEMTTGSVGNSDMAKPKPLEDSSSSEVESSDEDDDDDDDSAESSDAPKNKNDSDSSSESEKGVKPKPVAINVKKQTRDSSSESSSESSSDSDEPVRKNTQKQKKEESSDESDDTTETSDSD